MGNGSHNKITTWLPLIVGLSAALGMWAGLKVQLPRTEPLTPPDQVTNYEIANQKITDVLHYVESAYRDSLNPSAFAEQSIQNILTGLDPYSFYCGPADTEGLSDELDGDYSGFGFSFVLIDSGIYVQYVFPLSSASGVGMQVGDRITALDHLRDDKLRQFGVEDLDSMIRHCGKILRLEGYRFSKGGKETFSKSLTRNPVLITSVDLGHQAAPHVQYIRLQSIAQNSYRELMSAIEEFQSKNSKPHHLILDLRDNGGGLIPVAADLLNQFITTKDELLFYSKGAYRPKQEYKANGRSFFTLGKIVVLINENTASAAELLAGVLSQKKKAYLIGSPTYGKSTILDQFGLSDGSLIRLATSRYFFANGVDIQKPFFPGTADSLDSNPQNIVGPVPHKGLWPDELIKTDSQLIATRTILSEWVERKILPQSEKWKLWTDEDLKKMESKEESITWFKSMVPTEEANRIIRSVGEDELHKIIYSTIISVLKGKTESQLWMLKQDEPYKRALQYLQS